MIESIYRGSIFESSMYTFTQTGHTIEVNQYNFEKDEWVKNRPFIQNKPKRVTMNRLYN